VVTHDFGTLKCVGYNEDIYKDKSHYLNSDMKSKLIHDGKVIETQKLLKLVSHL